MTKGLGRRKDHAIISENILFEETRDSKRNILIANSDSIIKAIDGCGHGYI